MRHAAGSTLRVVPCLVVFACGQGPMPSPPEEATPVDGVEEELAPRPTAGRREATAIAVHSDAPPAGSEGGDVSDSAPVDDGTPVDEQSPRLACALSDEWLSCEVFGLEPYAQLGLDVDLTACAYGFNGIGESTSDADGHAVFPAVDLAGYMADKVGCSADIIIAVTNQPGFVLVSIVLSLDGSPGTDLDPGTDATACDDGDPCTRDWVDAGTTQCGHLADSLACVGVSISASQEHACARLADGAVKCWGANEEGQLGLGDTEQRGEYPGEMGTALAAPELGEGYTAVEVMAGGLSTCALLDNNRLKCWGHNATGSLGLGDTENRGDEPSEMESALPWADVGRDVKKVALSRGPHTASACALLDNGQVKCWGDYPNLTGYYLYEPLGDEPNEMGHSLPYIDLGDVSAAQDIAMGYAHACVLFEDGRVKCWGQNNAGELGLGRKEYLGAPEEMGDALPYADLGTNSSALQLSLGLNRTCAILVGNRVKCWGANLSGELGLGDRACRGDDADEMGDNLPFVDLGMGRTVIGLAAGGIHTCAILDNGGVKCWGGNSAGQLGLGDRRSRGGTPGDMGDNLPLVDLGVGRTAVGIAAGVAWTCAVLDNGGIKCWGNNYLGQLGQGDTATRGDEPGEMGDNLPFVDLGAPSANPVL